MSDDLIAPVAILAFFLLVITWTVGWCNGQTHMKNNAVKAGVAEWVAHDNGEPQFSWKK